MTRRRPVRDARRTLEEIEGDRWGDPPLDATPLVARCHRLRRVPLRDLAAGDLATLIGQRIGLGALLPLAIDIVADDPMVEAAYYPGDLLCRLLALRDEECALYPAGPARLQEIARNAEPGEYDDLPAAALRDYLVGHPVS